MYRIKQNGRTIDIVTDSEYNKRYPPDVMVRNNLKSVRMPKPRPPKPKAPTTSMRGIDYYRKLSQATKQKQKKTFEKTGRSFKKAMAKRRKR